MKEKCAIRVASWPWRWESRPRVDLAAYDARTIKLVRCTYGEFEQTVGHHDQRAGAVARARTGFRILFERARPDAAGGRRAGSSRVPL